MRSVTVEIPPLAAHVLDVYARRVEVDEATLLLDALRGAHWFREAAQTSLPHELPKNSGARA